MPVLEEEVFGPAVPVLRARDGAEALRLANQSAYGLGSAVWTADLERGATFAARLEAGHTAVNGMTVSDPRLPFGGIKDSGYGRELSRHGLFEFVNFHTVVVNAADGPRGRPGNRQRVAGRVCDVFDRRFTGPEVPSGIVGRPGRPKTTAG